MRINLQECGLAHLQRPRTLRLFWRRLFQGRIKERRTDQKSSLIRKSSWGITTEGRDHDMVSIGHCRLRKHLRMMGIENDRICRFW